MTVLARDELVDGAPALIFVNPAGPGRSTGTIRLGLLQQGTAGYNIEWRYARVFKEGYYGFGCLAQLANGRVGLLYESTAECERLDFISIDVDWIKGAE